MGKASPHSPTARRLVFQWFAEAGLEQALPYLPSAVPSPHKPQTWVHDGLAPGEKSSDTIPCRWLQAYCLAEYVSSPQYCRQIPGGPLFSPPDRPSSGSRQGPGTGKERGQEQGGDSCLLSSSDLPSPGPCCVLIGTNQRNATSPISQIMELQFREVK